MSLADNGTILGGRITETFYAEMEASNIVS